MTMTQGYARLLRRYAGDLAAQCMPIKAEATRHQAARHMEELQAINDQAGEAVERLRVTLHHVECGLRAAEEDRDELLALMSALVDRCAYDGVPIDSLPVWQAAHDAVMSRKTPNVGAELPVEAGAHARAKQHVPRRSAGMGACRSGSARATG